LRAYGPSFLSGLTEQLLDDHRVPPLAVQLPVAAIGADYAKPRPLVKLEARHVLRKDSGQQFPVTAPGVGIGAGAKGQQAGAEPAGVAVDVDRVLRDPGVARPAAVAARPSERDHLAAPLDHHRRVVVALLAQERRHLFDRARLGLEG